MRSPFSQKLDLASPLAGAALAIALLVPFHLAGQQSDNITARATVLEQIQVAGEQDLEFGDILPGFSASVGPDDADAGRFLVTGASGRQFSLAFTLPPALNRIGGGANLPISFPAGSAGVGSGAGTVSSTFTPTSSHTTTLNGTGELYVFIGGQVDPPASQQEGTYTGTITVDVAYTGG